MFNGCVFCCLFSGILFTLSIADDLVNVISKSLLIVPPAELEELTSNCPSNQKQLLQCILQDFLQGTGLRRDDCCLVLDKNNPCCWTLKQGRSQDTGMNQQLLCPAFITNSMRCALYTYIRTIIQPLPKRQAAGPNSFSDAITSNEDDDDDGDDDDEKNLDSKTNRLARNDNSRRDIFFDTGKLVGSEIRRITETIVSGLLNIGKDIVLPKRESSHESMDDYIPQENSGIPKAVCSADSSNSIRCLMFNFVTPKARQDDCCVVFKLYNPCCWEKDPSSPLDLLAYTDQPIPLQEITCITENSARQCLLHKLMMPLASTPSCCPVFSVPNHCCWIPQ